MKDLWRLESIDFPLKVSLLVSNGMVFALRLLTKEVKKKRKIDFHIKSLPP